MSPWVRLCLVVGACLSLAPGSAALARTDKPNFVIIVADDCTFRDIGCYGGQAHTPAIDRLAEEGLLMTRCFTAAPMCTPSRHNLYTGLYPVKTGGYPNHSYVKPDVKSIVHYLRPLGYRVALSGKAHVAPDEVFPFERSGDKNPDMAAIDSFVAECMAGETPFCQIVGSSDPHAPWDRGDPSRYPPDEVELPPYFVDTPMTRKAMSHYLAEVTSFDGQVRDVLKILDERGARENTMVMVVSEQGSTLPFGKWTLYDTGIQSAMVVRWPGKVEPGTTSAAMVEYVDVVPTLIEAAGGTPAEVLEGRSMLAVLEGETEHHKDFVYAVQTSRGIIGGPPHYASRSVRSERFKLIHNLDSEAVFTTALLGTPFMKEWWALVEEGDERAKELFFRYLKRPEIELYDVLEDPLEQVNVADDPEHQETIELLRAKLAAWMAQQGDEGHATELAAKERLVTTLRAAEASPPK